MGTAKLIAGIALMTSLTAPAGPSKYVFSMSFKVTSLNGELTRPGMKESGKSLKDFRFDHMEDLCRKAIYEPALAAHPISTPTDGERRHRQESP